jgi:hypothetical protein
VVEVGVATVQQPAFAFADRNPGVAARVSRQRDQPDLGVDPGQHPDRLEVDPRVAIGRVGDPSGGVRDV